MTEIKPLHYKIIYRNGDRIAVEIADFWRMPAGDFKFDYVDNPKYAFPGFNIEKKTYTSLTLWEQISFRVPNNIRERFPNTPPEELIKETEGKLVTDHFEFQFIN